MIMHTWITPDMKNTRFLVIIVLVIAIVVGQVSAVFAAPAVITGTVQRVTLETNANTAVTTVVITLLDKGASQTVRITIEAAIALGLVMLGGDGNPIINESILGQSIEINPTAVIHNGEDQHPVGSALATFFLDIKDLDYETIMAAHDEGTGFGVIAQALWLTKKLGGDAVLFKLIIDAKISNDFSAFALGDDGTTPKNWGQFKKAVMEGKKGKPGIVIADMENSGGGSGNNSNNGNGKDKEKNKDNKENNRRGNGNNN